jgi:hypothetical protein
VTVSLLAVVEAKPGCCVGHVCMRLGARYNVVKSVLLLPPWLPPLLPPLLLPPLPPLLPPPLLPLLPLLLLLPLPLLQTHAQPRPQLSVPGTTA